MRGLSTSGGRVLAILGYALLTSILVAHHEPWRDEVDAWLTARDETPLAVFKLAGSRAHRRFGTSYRCRSRSWDCTLRRKVY